jgi:branched-chain amino acid transport system permease protein
VIVGVANSLTVQYVDVLDGVELIMPLGLIFAVLILRPNGLFGRQQVVRV